MVQMAKYFRLESELPSVIIRTWCTFSHTNESAVDGSSKFARNLKYLCLMYRCVLKPRLFTFNIDDIDESISMTEYRLTIGLWYVPIITIFSILYCSFLMHPEYPFGSWLYMNYYMIDVMFQHEKLIIHRDIKAENVFLSTPGKVKLGDFGFSAQLTKGKGTINSLPDRLASFKEGNKAPVWMG